MANDLHDEHGDSGGDRSGEVRTLIGRRQALRYLAGAGLGAAGLVALVACGDDGSTTSTSTASSGSTGSSTASTASTTATTAAAAATGSTAASSSSTEVIPEETAGPYPGDGSNGPNVLTQDGVVRSDITSSFGSASGTATGVPLTVELTVLDSSAGGAALAGAAIYLWHCDQAGRYSMYSQGATDQNYLRGVQETDADGKVTFTSIFPAAYSGRWPHIHFEVYPSLDEATSAGDPRTTSQLAFPEDVCDEVYATDGYSASIRNMSQTSLATDNVFRDGWDEQLATVTGTVADGLTARLAFAV